MRNVGNCNVVIMTEVTSTQRSTDPENRVKEKEVKDMHGDPNPGVVISPQFKWQRNRLELWPLPRFII